MTWKDKLEIGLKEDAPYRKDNLPANQVRGPQVHERTWPVAGGPAFAKRRDGRTGRSWLSHDTHRHVRRCWLAFTTVTVRPRSVGVAASAPLRRAR